MNKNEEKTCDCNCGCEETTSKKNKCHSHHDYGHSHGQSNAIYGLGVIGALFYFLSSATSFTMVLLGIGKSIFWPAILMFKLLTYLQM